MSTVSVEAPSDESTRPEWRRLCHYYRGDDQRSVCKTASRKPGQDHTEAGCGERGHTICVVCTAICRSL